MLVRTLPASPRPHALRPFWRSAMPRRLLVIDGADHGQAFPLPESGTVRIGNGRSDADICLHDLYVAHAHCELTIEGERITVTDKNAPSGTLVNGKKVAEQELRLG